MASESSQSDRRIGVLVNYAAVVVIAVLFYAGKYFGWSVPVYAGIGVALVVALVGFVLLHVKTRLWKLVHSKSETLDEREMLVTRESLRYSYAIFTVVSLLLLLVLALTAEQHDSMLIVIFAALMYLAHTLPSSVVAWTQRRM